MAHRTPATEARLNIRVPSDVVERLDALIPKAGAIGAAVTLAGTADRSKIARLAVIRGVAVLEREAKRAGKGGRGA